MNLSPIYHDHPHIKTFRFPVRVPFSSMLVKRGRWGIYTALSVVLDYPGIARVLQALFGLPLKGSQRMKIEEGTELLALASGKSSFPIGEGDVLVDDKENPEAWLKGLELLEARYDEYSARAGENVKRFSAMTRLLDIIQSI